MNRGLLVEELRSEEGYRASPYLDTLQKLTVGHGTLIESLPIPSHTLTCGELFRWLRDPDRHEEWFQRDVTTAIDGAERYIGWAWSELSDVRKRVLCSMCYQLGYTGLSAFVKLKDAILDKEWARAKAEALNSLAARQTPERWKRHATRLEQG